MEELLVNNLINKNDLESYTSFAVVRNPYTRAISGFVWLLKDLKTNGTFDQFLKREGAFSKETLKGKQVNVEDHFYTQSKFITNHGKIAIDHILHFENLSKDFSEFSKSIDLNVTLNTHYKKNRKSRWDMSKLMTKNNIALIQEIYRDDFKNFNYPLNFNKWSYLLGYV